MYQHTRRKTLLGTALALLFTVTAMTGAGSMHADSTSDYQSWKQSRSSWSSLPLGNSPYHVSDSGCAVTSAAMLMVHSGSVTDPSFDPGVLVNYLNDNGGFDRAGNIQWYTLTRYSPSFTYMGAYQLEGTAGQKISTIRSMLEDGYYLIAWVGNRSHFVAIDDVEGKKITMMDPAGYETSLFGKYDASGVTELRVFRGADSAEMTVPETTQAPETTTTTETTTTELTTTTETTTTETTTTTTETTTTTAPATEQTTTETTKPVPAVTTPPKAAQTALPATTAVQTTTTAATTAVPAELFEINGEYFFMNIRFILTENLNLRAHPSTEHEILTVIPKGTQINVVAIDNDFTWGKVSYNGKTGWIYLDFAALGV